MVVCVRLPRFELVIAAGGPAALVRRPLALAPEAGRDRFDRHKCHQTGRFDRHKCHQTGQRVGEVSGSAEALGVHPGMAVGEALARCPQLGLVAADPLGVLEAWETVARTLEGIGAAVELDRPGLAYFDAAGLERLYGGLQGVMAAARRALDRAARLGAGPTRFCALAASLRARARRAVVVHSSPQRYLAPLPVGVLRHRGETEALVAPLERLGVRTLGELAVLPRAAVADRFGEPGLLAHRMARGADTPLRPRRVRDRLEESLELPEAASGPMLECALGLLVDRLLARPERRGHTLRAVTLAAQLVEGGTWREQVVFREALADPRRMRLAIAPRLGLLPAPAAALRLGVERLGPPGGEQKALLEQAHEARMARVREAVRQVRTVAGPYGALRALCVDPDSRVPERRVMLTPFEA